MFTLLVLTAQNAPPSYHGQGRAYPTGSAFPGSAADKSHDRSISAAFSIPRLALFLLKRAAVNDFAAHTEGSSVRTLLIDDAARLLGLSRRTVYYRIRDGRLQTVRTIGGTQRVLVSSVEALLHDIRAREDQRIARLLRGRTRRPSALEPEALPL